MSVRALRRLTKAEAFVQFQQNPELASTISGAARRWGCSRSTARQWLSEFTAPPVATAPAAMATPPAGTDAAMAAHAGKSRVWTATGALRIASTNSLSLPAFRMKPVEINTMFLLRK